MEISIKNISRSKLIKINYFYLIKILIFFQTSQLGYEHVIEWLNTNAPRPSSASDVLSKDEPDDEQDELDDADRIETSGDIISVPEIDEQQEQIDQVYYFNLQIF